MMKDTNRKCEIEGSGRLPVVKVRGINLGAAQTVLRAGKSYQFVKAIYARVAAIPSLEKAGSVSGVTADLEQI